MASLCQPGKNSERGFRLLVRRHGQRGGVYSRSPRARARGLYAGRGPKLPGQSAVPGESRQRAGHRFDRTGASEDGGRASP